MLNVASVCTGIAAPEQAWEPLGWRPYLMAEIEMFPIALLVARRGAIDARRSRSGSGPLLWGDFTSIKERFLKRFGRSLADIDVLVGGTPCQAFSVAGLRRSLGDDRGNLSLAFVRLANAIDAVRLRAGKPPVWIVWENVPGVLSTRDNAFGAVLGGLVGGDAALDPSARGGWTDAGVVAGPRRCAAWRILDAQHFGLAQRRRRVFVVARGYFGGAGRWDGPDALLPVIEGGGWHPAPRREAGQAVAGALAASLGGSDENDAADGRLAYCLNGGGMRRTDAESETLIPAVVGTLNSNGKAAGSATQQDAHAGMLVPIQDVRGSRDKKQNGIGIGAPGDSMFTLTARDQHAVAFAENSRAELRLEGGDGQTVAALKTGGGKPGQSYPAIAFRTTGNDGVYETGDRVSCLNTATDPNQSVLLQQMGVRRLTPRECERLQGFPDDYTLVPVKRVRRARLSSPKANRDGVRRYVEIDGVVWLLAADGPRYKALGNSMPVPVMEWIGTRVDAIDRLRRHVHKTRNFTHEEADMSAKCA